ncbi:DeoR/GlpR family DNA-binding transcription regulator [uncultured Vagococcus sp.]|uniref:DeoR/GlpR family DNA-binding transcription regulator n=1 Tax=uncultured Vagococcus sp. TaxID=189676 RepID=UPI0028D3AD52|nr:DeoR/GlpR family DNA-binding transcription regulator [uncultured Vagococcus sp.]
MKINRQEKIIELLQEKKRLKVAFIAEKLNVTEMTVRRDLKEMEQEGLLTRMHGGAKLNEKNELSFSELTHLEKKNIHLQEKSEIAQSIAQLIANGETIFLGSGTTIEFVYDYLTVEEARIVTNSIHVFDKFKHDSRFDLILIGGTYRGKTGSFVGTITNDFIETIYVDKAFIGVNAISENYVFNSNEEEGLCQKLILDSAKEKYIVADHSKFNKQDFYRFYSLDDIDYLITDSQLDSETLSVYQQIVTVIN